LLAFTIIFIDLFWSRIRLGDAGKGQQLNE
jgi:hypothetical protein